MIRNKIKKLSYRLIFTRHAKDEMLYEEFGEIHEEEIKEALRNGEIIEEYRDDKPYASYLVYGSTKEGRPLHVVCPPVREDERLVIITVYQPSPDLWIDFKRRKEP